MSVKVAFPDKLLVALKENQEQFQRKVFVYTLGKLFEAGRISGGLGVQILGCDLWEFYRLLSENSFYVIDYEEDEKGLEAQPI